ncbi:hypothetical protein ACYULU_01230 [Breznakiellaceae bacterium SP9]
MKQDFVFFCTRCSKCCRHESGYVFLLVFFHHDRKLFNKLHSAKWYREKLDNRSMKLSLTVEGEEIIL